MAAPGWQEGQDCLGAALRESDYRRKQPRVVCQVRFSPAISGTLETRTRYLGNCGSLRLRRRWDGSRDVRLSATVARRTPQRRCFLETVLGRSSRSFQDKRLAVECDRSRGLHEHELDFRIARPQYSASEGLRGT